MTGRRKGTCGLARVAVGHKLYAQVLDDLHGSRQSATNGSRYRLDLPVTYSETTRRFQGVRVGNERICDFHTVMTGELHHLLMTQSLIGKGLPAQQADEAAFEQGLEKGLAQPSLISELFVARAARVLGALAATSVSDYLSGLLIGAEVATLGQRYRTSGVTLVGDPALNARYSRAMRARGMTVNSCSGDEALLGGMARIMHGQD